MCHDKSMSQASNTGDESAPQIIAAFAAHAPLDCGRAWDSDGIAVPGSLGPSCSGLE